MYAVAGDLNPKPFGPPVVPPVEASELAGLREHALGGDARRFRTSPPQRLPRRSAFDQARLLRRLQRPRHERQVSTRDRSVVPSQALTLLNGPDALSHARTLAARLWHDSNGDPSHAAEDAWLLLFGRPITADEREAAVQFLADRRRDWQWYLRLPPMGGQIISE